jgi:hypothetical protein
MLSYESAGDAAEGAVSRDVKDGDEKRNAGY